MVSNLMDFRTLRRPTIQNESLVATTAKKITVSSIKNKELLVQLRENYDFTISFDSAFAKYFTVKGGGPFAISSNMYATSDNLSFWVKCASTATIEVIEVGA